MGRQLWQLCVMSPLNEHLSVILTIEPEVFKATIGEIIFHDCHEGGHLTEE